MRAPSTWIVALALAALAAGMALGPLGSASFTRMLSQRFSLADEAGLSSDRIVEIAEMVRAYVVDGEGPLPARVDGRPGFDASAVSHLDDVRRVLVGARVATGIIAAGLAVWLAVAVAGRRLAVVSLALRRGAALTAVSVGVAGVLALTDFDAFFAAFHGVFFAAGTWTFPADSLLIRVFPEPFWAVSGGAWAVIMLIAAAAYEGIGRWLGRAPARSGGAASMNEPSTEA